MEFEYKYSEVAPSGVLVRSTEPFVEPRWWDNKFLHPIWSWSSWFTMIAQDFGWEAPRRLFNKYWTR